MNSQKYKNTKPLLLLLLVFVLPVIGAKVVLSMNLYHGGATNKGELLDPNTSYQSLAMTNPLPKSWQIIYLLPKQCDSQCQNRLYILHQSHIALGRDQDRVIPIILLQQDSDISALGSFDFNTANISPQLAGLMAQQQLIIVDPLGALVMRYQQVDDKQQQILLGKAMVADLRKMLKLSRVG
ncbi:hypothetical protein [Shewanella sp. Isolate11]|uniref:hypothetical protein n=1 Tax=Shewanella sp. Isolate11 TaxID=2908530 RepID=UPI001EFD4715|nr:hypothetical protein [Shewanella sp. Isolate11]MCG9698045.1 hypothetical protein [Shewanella sp. Isolate11]